VSQPGQGMPPKKNNNGLIIGLIAAVLVVAIGLGIFWFINQNNNQQATPTTSTQTTPTGKASTSKEPTSSPTKESSKSKDPTPTRSSRASNAPAMPDSFGNFTLQDRKEMVSTYTSSDNKFFVASYGAGATAELTANEFEDPQTVDGWICGTSSSMLMCAADAHSGVVVTTLQGEKSAPKIVEVSKTFLEAWK